MSGPGSKRLVQQGRSTFFCPRLSALGDTSHYKYVITNVIDTTTIHTGISSQGPFMGSGLPSGQKVKPMLKKIIKNSRSGGQAVGLPWPGGWGLSSLERSFAQDYAPYRGFTGPVDHEHENATRSICSATFPPPAPPVWDWRSDAGERGVLPAPTPCLVRGRDVLSPEAQAEVQGAHPADRR